MVSRARCIVVHTSRDDKKQVVEESVANMAGYGFPDVENGLEKTLK